MGKIFEKLRNFVKKFVRVIKDSLQLFLATDMSLYSSNAAFFLIISSIPIFMLLFSLLSLIPIVSIDSIVMHINLLFPNLPYVKQVLTYVINIANSLSTGGAISINSITAFVAGSTALYSFIIGIRKIHNITYRSSFIRLRILSLVNMLVFFIAIFLMLIAFILGSMILGYVEKYIPIASPYIQAILSYKYLACFVIIFVLMISLYATSTNFERKFKDNAIGAAVTTFLWLAVSNLFSIYFKTFPLSASVYGSLAGIVVVLLWIYICMLFIFYGAAINEIIIPEVVVLKKQKELIQQKLMEGKDEEVDSFVRNAYKKKLIKPFERPDLFKD